MKAAILDKYDPNGRDLKIREIPRPEIEGKEVLVRVRTAGVNILDNQIIRGKASMIVPITEPFIQGNEFAGVIEELGRGVKGFSVGDRVFGRMPFQQLGAFADYVAVSPKVIAKVPDHYTDEEAACIPLDALTIDQAFDLMKPKIGQTLAIIGGPINLVMLGIALAKWQGMVVVTVGSNTDKKQYLEQGANQFIDYRTENYVSELSNVDFVLDLLGGAEIQHEGEILKRGGTLVTMCGEPNGDFAVRMGLPIKQTLYYEALGLKNSVMEKELKGKNYYYLYPREDGAALAEVVKTLDEIGVKPDVGAVFDLANINKAVRQATADVLRGKVVLKIS